MTSAVPDSTTCIDLIKREIDPQNIASLRTSAFRWHYYGACGSLVLFTLFSTAAFVVVNLTAPIYTPVAGISVILLCTKAENVYRNFEGVSQNFKEKADKIQHVKRNYDVMNHYTPENIQLELLRMGVNWLNIPGMRHNPSELNTVKPLIAAYRYFIQGLNKCADKNQVRLAKIQHLIATAPNNELNEALREEIARKQMKTWVHDNNASQQKIKAAFIQAVILRPTFKGNSNQLFSFTATTDMERAFGTLFNESYADCFVRFNNRSIAPITHQDVKRLSIAELRDRILHAMPA